MEEKSLEEKHADELTSIAALDAAPADFAPLIEDTSTSETDELDRSQRDSILAQEAFDKGVQLANEGKEEEAIELFIKASRLAETAREWYIAALACKRVGDFLITPRAPMDYEKAFRMYRRAIASFERCGLQSEARELSYGVLLWKMRRSGALKIPVRERIELLIFWLISGFGFRPLRVLATSVFVILGYGLIYWFVDGIRSPGEPADLIHAIYFSGITFATVGYGDYLPAEHTQLLALSEGVIGAFMNGFFVVVLANRLNRA